MFQDQFSLEQDGESRVRLSIDLHYLCIDAEVNGRPIQCYSVVFILGADLLKHLISHTPGPHTSDRVRPDSSTGAMLTDCKHEKIAPQKAPPRGNTLF